MSVLDRLMPSDAQWARMAGLIPARAEMPGSAGRDNRMFLEAVPWIVRTGVPGAILWTSLALETWGSGGSARWSVKGVRHRILVAMAEDAGFDELIVDSTVVRGHQHAAGGNRGLMIRRLAIPAAA